MMREGATFDELVVEAIRRIRGTVPQRIFLPWCFPAFADPHLILMDPPATGRWRVIALTNNFAKPDLAVLGAHERLPARYAALDVDAELAWLGWTEGAVPPRLRALFDDFCDSSELGTRYVADPPLSVCYETLNPLNPPLYVGTPVQETRAAHLRAGVPAEQHRAPRGGLP